MADKDVSSIIAIIEQEITAAEQEAEQLAENGAQEAVKIEEAVVARLKELLASVMSALGA